MQTKFNVGLIIFKMFIDNFEIETLLVDIGTLSVEMLILEAQICCHLKTSFGIWPTSRSKTSNSVITLMEY